MDRGERIAVAAAAGLVLTAAAAWAIERPSRPPIDPDRVAEPVRAAPMRELPVAPPLYPVGTTTVLPSGLEVTDVIEGAGLPLRPGDLAVVELSVWSAVDGELQDSTRYGPGPTRIALRPGEIPTIWEEGLDWMRVGGERLLVAPAGLDRGSAGSVVLVDLVGILGPPLPPPAVELHDRAGFGVADLVVGEGSALVEGSVATLDYSVWATGPTRVDGTVPEPGEPVDSSLLRVNPLVIRVGRDPLAWGPALVGMHAGGRRVVRVPPALAFGEGRRPPDLPEGADVLVEVELHDVK